MTSAPSTFTIKQATSPHDLNSIRELFTSYSLSLPISLSFQNFNTELATLPGLYAPPNGALFITVEEENEKAVGCVGLRPLELKASISNETDHTPAIQSQPKTKACEMKRLYTLPSFRGTGIGKRLANTVIAEAKNLGYDEMRLDTLPSMVGAMAMYRKLGFVECERYYDSPIEGTVFLRLDLT